MQKVFNTIEQLVGNTPLYECVRTGKIKKLSARIFLKLEMFNPTGSAKDRAALFMLEEAEKKGLLKPGTVVIEPTSGNTGIGLALFGALRGYRVIIVMPENMSAERRLMMSAYGAEVVLTPASEGMSGAVAKAEELSAGFPCSFIPGQFKNPDNALAHRKTTGPEIWEASDGKVDIFVASVGTGGTLTGAGEFLKSKNKALKIVAVEPASSPVLSGGKPGPHCISGIGAGFVPDVLNTKIYDEVIAVTDEEAKKNTRFLAATEGILAGVSSGAVFSAVLELASRKENAGKNIAAVLPDTGMRYLSTGLFSESPEGAAVCGK